MIVSARSSAAPSASPGPEAPRPARRARTPRDIGLDQADADDAGLGNTTPPEPTKHGMPYVEEAHMAEAGPVGFDDEPSDDDERAPTRSRATSSPPPARAPRSAPPTRGAAQAPRAASHLPRALHRRAQRVQWPDRRQVGQGTAVMLGFVVLAGGYLGLLDAIWKPLIEAIL